MANPRGGKREGAGRKPQGFVRLHIQVTEEQANWLREQDNVSEAIRLLIQKEIKREAREEYMDRMAEREKQAEMCGSALTEYMKKHKA